MKYFVPISFLFCSLLIFSCKKETTVHIKNDITLNSTNTTFNGTLYDAQLFLYGDSSKLIGKIGFGTILPNGGITRSFEINEIVKKVKIVFNLSSSYYYYGDQYFITLQYFDIEPNQPNEININDSTLVYQYQSKALHYDPLKQNSTINHLKNVMKSTSSSLKK